MRFLLSALAAVALVSAVSAQDYSSEDILDDSSFDISGGAIRSVKQEFKSAPLQKQKIQAPVQQQRYEAPVQAKIELPVQTKYEAPVQAKYQAPVQQAPIMKEKTIMLQPILMMPKQKAKASKMLKFDVDRSMAYRVSPKVSSENSRSVDISFSPILNSKMRNILLSGEEEIHNTPRESFIETSPLLSTYQSKQAPVQYRAAPVQFRAPVQQQTKWSGLQGLGMSEYESFENPSSSSSSSYWSSPRFTGRFQSGEELEQGLQNVGGNINTERFQFLDEQPISPRSYQFTQEVEQPRFQSTIMHMNPYMTEDVASNTLLSSFDSSLPSIPITEKNIVSLGIQQPIKLNQVLKTCIANNVNTPACLKVIDSAKLLARHPVANQVFEGIQI